MTIHKSKDNIVFSVTATVLMLIVLMLVSGCSRRIEEDTLSGYGEESTQNDSQNPDVEDEAGKTANQTVALEGGSGAGKNAASATAADTGAGTDTGSAAVPNQTPDPGYDSHKRCYVFVTGAVNSPGVYELSSGDRIFSAVDQAGGLAMDACGDYVNLALNVRDGMRIWIPTLKEADHMRKGTLSEADLSYGDDTGIVYIGEDGSEISGNSTSTSGGITQGNIPDATEGAGERLSNASSGDGSKSGSDPSKININTADQNTLCRLSGIGASKAKAIISYREEKGGFSSIEEITKVSGIGNSIFDRIKDDICV